MGLFKKDKNKDDSIEFKEVDRNQKDRLQVVVSRLENDTKVTIKQFFAEHQEDPESKVAYWVNEKQKFKQPVSDYYISTLNKQSEGKISELKQDLNKLKQQYEKELKADKLNPNINIKDLEHEIEVLEHKIFLNEHAEKGYSILTRNLENYRKIEYIQIGSRLYPLGFNPKLMTYFIIPIDKDITLDKHRENVTLKHTTAFQKLIASATILMLILTCVLALIVGIAGYKLYFAYDETNIAELERVCASSSMLNMEQYTKATQEFQEAGESFNNFVNDFVQENSEQALTNPTQTGELN